MLNFLNWASQLANTPDEINALRDKVNSFNIALKQK